MNAAHNESIPPAAYQELRDYLRQSGSTLSAAEAVAGAIKQWIAQNRAAEAPLRGYQWKRLFLPETTRLRMSYYDETYYAEVVGEDIIFRGEAVSPRQLTVAIAGDGRNAWRDLWVRLPGEKHWTCATVLRNRLEKQAAIPPPSPAEAMTTAAKAMSNALNAAVVLIEHVDHQSKTITERRLPKHRRQYDVMSDD